MSPNPTIRDVARVAGVSIKTVSRALNEDRYVAPDTAERVRAAIAQLGYRVNPFARSLRTGRDQAVGLIVESIRDPFFSAVVDAVEEAARDAGLFLIIASAGRNAAQERAVLNGMLNRSVLGLLIVPCHLTYGPEDLPHGDGAVPAVFVDRPRPGDGGDADVVMIDNLATGRAAARHLIDHGHTRIAFVGSELDHYPVSARLAGYREALQEAGLSDDLGLVIAHDRSTDDDQQLLTAALTGPRPATAVLTGNALASLAVARELHRTQRTDVAFVSFDDFPMADSLTPAITVGVQDPVAIGRAAFELLLSRAAGDRAPARRVVLPTSFIERGSGELPPPPGP